MELAKRLGNGPGCQDGQQCYASARRGLVGCCILLSCLYRIRGRLPCDFALLPHLDERRAALRHLAKLGRGDLVVYDRGYYSLALLQAHSERRVEAVFRLKRDASRQVSDFVAAGSCDEVVTMGPAGTAPLRLRLVKYAAHETPYVLGTTLLDAQLYPLADLAALYHGRWSVEELYKITSVPTTP